MKIFKKNMNQIIIRIKKNIKKFVINLSIEYIFVNLK